MYFYWAIIAPILPALAIFLSRVLIKEKKRLRLILLSIICVFNIYVSFNLINIFRRDYNGDFSIFPLINYVVYLIIVNVIFFSMSFLILMKFDTIKENRFINSIKSFFCKLKKKCSCLRKLLIFLFQFSYYFVYYT